MDSRAPPQTPGYREPSANITAFCMFLFTNPGVHGSKKWTSCTVSVLNHECRTVSGQTSDNRSWGKPVERVQIQTFSVDVRIRNLDKGYKIFLSGSLFAHAPGSIPDTQTWGWPQTWSHTCPSFRIVRRKRFQCFSALLKKLISTRKTPPFIHSISLSHSILFFH